MTGVKNTFSAPDASGDNVFNAGGTIKIDGTELTSSAEEINKLDDMSASKDELAETANIVANDSTLTLGTAGTTQTVTIQAKDADGNNATGVHKFTIYMCTDANGATPSEAGCQVGVTATTGKILKEVTSKLVFEVVTDVNGVAVLAFNNTGGGGAYTDRLALVLPHSAKPVVSAALAVATA